MIFIRSIGRADQNEAPTALRLNYDPRHYGGDPTPNAQSNFVQTEIPSTRGMVLQRRTFRRFGLRAGVDQLQQDLDRRGDSRDHAPFGDDSKP